MQELRFETGVEEYSVNGMGTLCFSPTDPGLFARFEAFQSELEVLLDEWRAELDNAAGEREEGGGPSDALAATQRLDRALKLRLGEVFGPGNDFEELLGGVNLLATTDAGTTVLQNLLEALRPVLQDKAAQRRKKLESEAKKAVRQAHKRRDAVRGE